MNCLQCNQNTDYIFCRQCTPRFGDIVKIGNLSIFVGKFPFKLVLAEWLRNKKIIRWWVGTDVLLLHTFPPGRGKISTILHRLKTFLLEPLISEHWLNGRYLATEFICLWGWTNPKKCKVQLWCGRYGKVGKYSHKTFNIIYYHPVDSIYSRWVYGIDIIEWLQEKFLQANWIKLDGSQNMNLIYPIADLYVRPSRHDGFPRIVEECLINAIPVVQSQNRQYCFEKIGQYQRKADK